MPRLLILVALLTVMLTGAAPRTGSVVVARDATPAASPDDGSPEGGSVDDATIGIGGVGLELLGWGEDFTLASPADLAVARLQLAPAAEFPLAASNPTALILLIEAGTLTIRVDDMAWSLTREGAVRNVLTGGGDDLAEASESVAMGAEATVTAGDLAFVPGSVDGEFRNDGAAPLSALMILVGPAGGMGEATPTP